MPYIGIGPKRGQTVDFDGAEEYVLERCGLKVSVQTEETEGALHALEEWYFSGNWVAEKEDDDDAAGFG